MTGWLNAHPALSAALTAMVCCGILGYILLRQMRRQDRRGYLLMRRIDQKLTRTEGGMKSGVQTMAAAMNHAAENLSRVSDSMESRQERMRREMEEKMDALQASTAGRLDEMAGKLGADMQTALESRIGESFRAVSEQLERVYRGLGEMQALAANVGDLKKVMSGVKTRGVWGEVRLKGLLEDDLPRGTYMTNVCVKPGSQERVEFAVKMPGKDRESEVLLPIDSKFPVEAHARLLSARENGTPEEEKKCRKALEDAIVTEGKRISSKYIAPPLTTDFAVMFLPTESLYAEALMLEGLTERLQNDYKVLCVGPTNLSALLSCLQMGFRTLAVEKRSGEILSMLGGVRKEFDSFGELIDKARTRLEMAAGDLDSVSTRTRALNKKLGEMESLPEREEK